MTRFTMTNTVTQNGVSYTNGQTYQLRSREAKLLIKAGNATKASNKGH